MTVAQFTRFRIGEDQVASMLAASRTALDSNVTTNTELQRVLLVRLDGGDWLDIALWADDSTADDAGSLPLPRSREELFSHIEELLGEESGLVIIDIEPRRCS